MNSVRKISVPVDFSTRSLNAAEYAAGMALQFGAELHVMHVVPALDYEFSMVEPLHERLGELDSIRSSRVQAELENIPATDPPSLTVHRHVAEGDPAAEIIRFAHSDHVELIIMPTNGRGAIRRFLLGSVVSKVLHDSECPVWTGTHWENPRQPFSLGHILCAVDLGPLSHSIYCAALAVARQFNSKLTLIHVAPRLGVESEAYSDESWRQKMTATTREQMHKLTEGSGAEPELLIEPGDPDKVVPQTAARLQANLVVIGRSQATGGLGRLRTNAYGIIRHSPCAVLSV